MTKDDMIDMLKSALEDGPQSPPSKSKTVLGLAVLALATTLSEEFPFAQLFNRGDDERPLITDDSAKILLRAQVVRLIRELDEDAVMAIDELFSGLYHPNNEKVVGTLKGIGLEGDPWDAALATLQGAEHKGEEETQKLALLAAIPAGDTYH